MKATAAVLTFLACSFLFVLTLAPGCLAPRDTLRTSSLAVAYDVLARHDAYVQGDVELAPAGRAAALDEAADVRALLELPAVERASLAPPLRQVCDRHDVYVQADPTLDPLGRDVFLSSTSILRELVKPPG